MHANQETLDLIKGFEKLRLRAYQDGGGVWTVGYGSIKGVHPGMIITEEQAEEMLASDLMDAESAVNKWVKISLTDNQFGALTSLTFNIGSGNFQKSTLLKLVNSGKIKQAAEQFLVWNKDRVNGQGPLVVIDGLTNRRKAERVLFLTA